MSRPPPRARGRPRIVAGLAAAILATGAIAAGPQPQQIAPAGSQASTAGPAEHFTGRVRVDPVWAADGRIDAGGSLNALGEMMKVLEARRQRGLQDPPGREPGPVATGRELLEAGTAHQTRLSGAPVEGPLFDFAPAIDGFLKAHLFGDIFGRDNLDWQSRELATVAALSALSGVESQLASHVRISLNVGLTAAQLCQFADVLGAQGAPDAARRLRAALQPRAAAPPKP